LHAPADDDAAGGRATGNRRRTGATGWPGAGGVRGCRHGWPRQEAGGWALEPRRLPSHRRSAECHL